MEPTSAVRCQTPRHQYAYDRSQFLFLWLALLVSYWGRSWTLVGLYAFLVAVRLPFAQHGLRTLLGWSDFEWHTHDAPEGSSVAYNWRAAWVLSLLAGLIILGVCVWRLTEAVTVGAAIAAQLAWVEVVLCVWCWFRSRQQRGQLPALAALLDNGE